MANNNTNCALDFSISEMQNVLFGAEHWNPSNILSYIWCVMFSLLQAETLSAFCLVEPGGLEDGPVFSASCGSLPLPVSAGQQHLCEAHVHGAERTLHQALQEEGAFKIIQCFRPLQDSRRKSIYQVKPSYVLWVHLVKCENFLIIFSTIYHRNFNKFGLFDSWSDSISGLKI